EVEVPVDDNCLIQPIGIDEKGSCVEIVIPLGVPTDKFAPTAFVQHWSLKTGKVLHQFADDRYASYHQILPDGGMLLAGQSRVNIPQAESVIVPSPFPPGSDRVTNESPSFVEWRLNTTKVRRTVIADKGVTLWRRICVNQRGDKALFFMREPYDGELRPIRRSLIMADAKSGMIQNLGSLSLSHIEKGAWSNDERFLVGIGNAVDSTNAVLFRSELSSGTCRAIAETDGLDDSYVSDLKLIKRDQEIAIATSHGLFQVFDAKTGEELRKVECVRPSSRLSILYVFVVTAVTWLVLWFWATRRKRDQGFDFGRYLVLTVFGVGLTSGLLLLAFHDPYSQSNLWLLPLLFAVMTTGAFLSLILLFARRCSSLAAGYSLISLTTMGLYVVWLTFHQPI
ncbi:MAG TPA: hypothetical protein VM260_14435, partial [Pirellula sp.]|nr:hypothetical protein [Pirellula sp.]